MICGAYHNLALSSKGRLFSWGSNSHGQLGQGGSPARIDPNYAHFEREDSDHGGRGRRRGADSDDEDEDDEGDEGDAIRDEDYDSELERLEEQEMPQPLLPPAGDGVPVEVGSELWYPQELPYFRTLQVFDCDAGFTHSACIAGGFPGLPFLFWFAFLCCFFFLKRFLQCLCCDSRVPKPHPPGRSCFCGWHG